MAGLLGRFAAWMPGAERRLAPGSASPPQSPRARGSSPENPERNDFDSPLTSPTLISDLGQSLDDEDDVQDASPLATSTLHRRQSALLRELALAGARGVDDSDDDAILIRDSTAAPSPEDIIADAREDGGSKAAQVMNARGEATPLIIKPRLAQSKAAERLAVEHQMHTAYTVDSAAGGKCACFGRRWSMLPRLLATELTLGLNLRN
ncbi:hypothetical protein M885DRAFT_533327 [Pelagophyceae sp. CCMP2097]|nr:hypothetical protein M885DRAFT_533327 [Pelagophyceae sp. CCMP2097]